MLRALHIRNLAIIDTLELEFQGGLTVLSGETGAGKSILIDALGLVLGDRADATLVRAGQHQAEVSAEFTLDASLPARGWLREQAMEEPGSPDNCLLRRVVGADGRSRAFINGAAASLANLRELGEMLVEIHGQNEHQGLLRSQVQRDLLDDYAGHDPLLTPVRDAACRLNDLDGELERLRTASGRDPAEIDYLQFQLRELEALNLAAGELQQLDEDQRRLANAGTLLEDGQRVGGMLDGNESSVSEGLSEALDTLNRLSQIDPAFGEIAASLEPASIQVQEAAETLARTLDRLDLDPSRLEEVERRLESIHDLARKHRVKPAELPGRLEALRTEIDSISGAAEALEKLDARRQETLGAYREAARKLSASRRRHAGKLARAVQSGARELGMPDAVFRVDLATSSESPPRGSGDDEVRFDFSANPGQPPRALSKVASGGELSRLALTIQIAVQKGRATATLIFDEVDAGVGGATADVVGSKLRQLAGRRQVLCVTHLAQVAAQGQQHLSIRKEVLGKQTRTQVTPLGKRERVAEIARMLGGRANTAAVHAQDMLERAGSQTL